MNQENWNQAKEIFYAALQKNTDEREKYLAQVCVGDPQLLSDVKTLLASYKSEFLEEPINNFLSENDTEQFSSASQFQNGDKINHYTIIKTLGKGGMGEVYLAKDNKLDRLVAVKVLHKGAGKKAAKRLLREARSAAKLNHPNICSIYEVGETDNFPFIVMQYVEGETLDKLIRRNALTANQSIEFVRQIADALEEAHSHHLAHRDIKPANIIIDSKQQVKVLDFSLAKKVILETDGFSESMLSEFGMVAGTIAYMSPEQARGHEIDSRTDIWSLGVLFYEMLTGTLPFSGDSKSDIIASILTKDPPKLSLTFSNISTNFDEIIIKALQKDKNLRYSSIKEFSANLEQLTKDSHNFTKDNLSEVNDKTTALFRADFVSKDSLHSPTSEINQATYKSERLSIFQTASNKINWHWLIPSALIVSILIGSVYWKFYGNNSAKSDTFAAESRNNWQVSTLISMKRKPIGDLSEFKFSPDGKLFSFLIFGEETNDIYIKQVDQSEPKKITDGKAINHTPIWSPDGQKIAFVSNRENKNAIWSIPYLGGTPVLMTTTEINRINFKLKKWSNDSKRIYFETSGQLKTIELESGRIEDIKLPDIKNTEDFAVSNDEKTIAFAVAEGGNKNIWVHTIGSNDARQITKDEGINLEPVFFPDNQRIIYSSKKPGNSYQIFSNDIYGSQPIQLTLGDSNGHNPIVSPTGSKIIYYSDTNESNVFSFDLKTKKETSHTANTRMQLFPNQSPDSNKIVFQSTDENTNILNSPLKIKSLIDNSETIQIAQNGGYPRWTSNGESITFLSSQDNITNIWKVDPVSRKAIQITRNGISFEGYSRSPFNLLATPFSWAKTQRKIFYVSKQSGGFNIWSVDENGLNEQMLTKNEDKNFKYFSPTPSSDDSKIAFTFRIQSEPNKFKYGLAIISNNVVQNLYETDSLVRLLGWNGKNDELLVAEKTGKDVEIFKFPVVVNSKPISVSKLVGANIHGVTLSPDTTKIAYPARRQGIDNIYIYSANEKENQLTSNLDESILFSGINWSNSGDKLFYSKQFGGFQISMITDTR